MSKRIRAISDNGGIVICAIDSTDILRDMETYHKSSAVVSAALGRLLTGACLMSSWLKSSDDSLTVRINGGGPIGTVLAVADGDGNVRGYAENNIVEIPYRADGKLDVGAAVGHNGTIAVIRDLGLKEPYIGQIELASGEIAEDITSYYAASEQTPTVCALGVLVNKDLSIQRGGGFLLQLLPGATEEEITKIENNIKNIPSITEMLEQGKTIYDIIQIMMEGFAPEILDEDEVNYLCKCSTHRSEEILMSLGKEELAKMQKESPTASLECHFCDKVYTILIQDILDELNAHTE